MPKYVIEREIPGAGKMSAQELKAISQKSCGVLKGMGPQIQWVHSHVTDDKIYCVYVAPNEEAVREHARQGAFPASFQHTIAIGVQQFINAGGTEYSGLSQRDINASVDASIGRVNAFLKPYQPYFPPLLAFGLFIILWGVMFLIHWLGKLWALLIFYLIKKTKFIIIQEIDVKAQRIEL